MIKIDSVSVFLKNIIIIADEKVVIENGGGEKEKAFICIRKIPAGVWRW